MPTGEEMIMLATLAVAAIVGLVTVIRWLFGPAETHEPTMRRGWQRPTGGGHWVNDASGGGYQPYDGGSSCPSGLCTASRSNTLTAGEVQAHDATRRAWFEAEAFGAHPVGMSRADLDAQAVERWDASHSAPEYTPAPAYSLPTPTMTHHHAPTPVHNTNTEYVYTPLPPTGNTNSGMAPAHHWISPEIPPSSEWGPPQLGDGSETVDGDWRWADSSHGDLVPVNRK